MGFPIARHRAIKDLKDLTLHRSGISIDIKVLRT